MWKQVSACHKETSEEMFGQKWNFCHYLLAFISFQTCMTFFLLWMPINIFKKKRQWGPNNCLCVCVCVCVCMCVFCWKNSYSFRRTWGWVNDNRIFIFEWSIPLTFIMHSKSVYIFFTLVFDITVTTSYFSTKTTLYMTRNLSYIYIYTHDCSKKSKFMKPTYF